MKVRALRKRRQSWSVKWITLKPFPGAQAKLYGDNPRVLVARWPIRSWRTIRASQFSLTPSAQPC